MRDEELAPWPKVEQLAALIEAGPISIERQEIKNPRIVEVVLYEGLYGDHHISVKANGVTHQAVVRKLAHRHPLSSITTIRTLVTMIEAHEALLSQPTTEDEEYYGDEDCAELEDDELTSGQ